MMPKQFTRLPFRPLMFCGRWRSETRTPSVPLSFVLSQKYGMTRRSPNAASLTTLRPSPSHLAEELRDFKDRLRHLGPGGIDMSLDDKNGLATLILNNHERRNGEVPISVHRSIKNTTVSKCSILTLLCITKMKHRREIYRTVLYVCVSLLPIYSGHQVRWTYQPGSHRRKVTQDFHPPSFCGACFNFSREKDSAIPFPRRP